jgi:threonine synthase
MRFLSTRNKQMSFSFSDAVKAGLAPDGGLFVPDHFPIFDMDLFQENSSIQFVAKKILDQFIKDDSLLSSFSQDIIDSSFTFSIPLKHITETTAVLELFHGPTAAFKDVGARFLAACLGEIAKQENKKYTILVATSGDTGGAVAAAFDLNDRFKVIILYPKGKVSPLQEKQLTCWGSNVVSIAVNGSFDDCQRLAKSAFSNNWWKESQNLTSANSINIARILPQSIYYAAASLWYLNKTGMEAGFVIPSGNLGNGVAALWAKEMGFPIRSIAFSTNENKSIVDYFKTNAWKPQETKVTLANAMDVGNPSNIERLLDLYPTNRPIQKIAQAKSVNDKQIINTIKNGPKNWGEVWCPHTATAVYVREQIAEDHLIIVSTAHPAKFLEVVQPLISFQIEVPKSLTELYNKESRFYEIEANDSALIELIKQLK